MSKKFKIMKKIEKTLKSIDSVKSYGMVKINIKKAFLFSKFFIGDREIYFQNKLYV